VTEAERGRTRKRSGTRAARGRPIPNVSDVAARAGVTISTVSNSLNHPEKVAPATRERVAAAIADLGYVPNHQARALATGTSDTLGLLLTDIGNSAYVEMALGAEEAAHRLGLNVLLANSDTSLTKQESYLDVFNQDRFAGILVSPFEASREAAAAIRALNPPAVFLVVASPNADHCSVVIDEAHGGYLALQHLIGLGRRRLMFVNGPERLVPLLERRIGVDRAVSEAGGAVAIEYVDVPAVNAPEGRSVGRMLLDRPSAERPDAIFAASDLLALGIVQAIRHEVRVPEDISIIGYDNNRAAWESEIPLSTVAQPYREAGERAVALVVDEIRDPVEHRHVMVALQPEVVPRASTGNSPSDKSKR
jgi:LacI family transcriptional regulator